MSALLVPADDLPDDLVPPEDLPEAPRPGMGDLQAAEHARGSDWSGTGNIPVSMLTDDAETNRRMAETQAAAGNRHNITGMDAVKAGGIAGGFGLSFLPGVPAAILSSGLLGGGLSDEKTLGGTAKDAAVSGAAGGALARFLPWLFGKVGGYAGGKLSAAAARADEMAAKGPTADLARKTGQYGGLRQAENKAIREAAAMESAGTISEENAALLAKARESGRFGEALNEALANDLEFLTTRSPEVAAAKGAMVAAREGLPEAIAAERARILSGSEAKAQIAARLKRYGPMGVAGAVAGHVVGGPFGALLGGASGAAVRPMIHAVRRGYQHPAVQTAVWSPVARAFGSATDAAGPAASSAASQAAPATLDELIDFLRSKGLEVRTPALGAADEEVDK